MKIDKNIPLPKARSQFPFHDMEIGDSFCVTEDKLRSTRTLANTFGGKLNRKFTVRKFEGGYRCWRIK